MSFSQALSGLDAASKNLDVIGNNIANSQTGGFKGSTVQFADVYADSKIGLGVSVAGVIQNFNTGSLETTGRGLDLAISGQGFFRFEQGGETVYSRNGQVTKTPDGYLVNAQGARLLGATGPIQVPTAGMTANATTSVKSQANLDAGSDIITAAFDPTDPTTYSYSTIANTFDSLGNMQTVSMHYVKTGVNQYTVHSSLNGVESASAPQVLDFSSNGTLVGYVPSAFTYPMTNGANALTFDFDATGTTQFGDDFSQNGLVQDGYTSGSMVGISIDEAGNVIASYSNEQKVTVGSITLANFANAEGLKPVGDNAWIETSASGQAIVGVPGTGLLGSTQAGVLEASNVDMGSELVKLIIAQRTYQANANTVKTQSEVLQQAVSLRS